MNSLPDAIPAAASSSPWKICIWFYHLRSSTGTTGWSGFDPNSILGTINDHYDGLFEFSICGTTYINDDRFVNMDLGSGSTDFNDLNSYITSLGNAEAEGCVRVFLSNSVAINTSFFGGYAFNRIDYSGNAGAFLANTTAEIWSHELGHYFTLPHTFSGQQYVNSPVTIGGIQYTCLQLGDGFCDTPADRDPQCLGGLPTCSATCTVQDPLGVDYNPDETLIMSYYQGCTNRFSAEQRQAMRVIYLYHPEYEALRQPDSDCIYPQTGLIIRQCPNDALNPTGYLFEPVKGLEVTITDGNNTCNGLLNQTDALGYYVIEPSQCTFTGSLRNIIPQSDYTNPLDGVSTFDNVIISRALLGQITLSPYQLIAADANNSGSVTTFDNVAIRKLILGITTDLPAGNWRYVPNVASLSSTSFDSQFNDIFPFDAVWVDPFQGFTRTYLTAQSNLPNSDSWMDFVRLDKSNPITTVDEAWSLVAIKVGDVNCSANIETATEPPVDEIIAFETDYESPYSIPQNDTVTLQIIANVPDKVAAWQVGIVYPSDSIEVLGAYNGNTTAVLDSNYFHYAVADVEKQQGMLNAIWYSEDSTNLDVDGKVLFEIDIATNASILDITQSLMMSNKYLQTKFYDENGVEIDDVSLSLHITEQLVERASSFNHQQSNSSLRKISVYPVPFRDKVILSTEMNMPVSGTFSLFDSKGQLMMERNITLDKGRNVHSFADLSNFTPGAYFYQLRTQDFVENGRLIKE